jgi:hypothetical protein
MRELAASLRRGSRRTAVVGVAVGSLLLLTVAASSLSAGTQVACVESDQLLGTARELLRRRFHIAHSTIQVEREAPDGCTDC